MGCGQDVVDIAWTYHFDNAETRTGTAGLTAQVRQGSCGGGGVLEYSATWLIGSMPSGAPRALSPGEHSFEIFALDASCAVVARACDAMQIPEGTQLHQTLTDTTGSRLCEPGSCRGGTCETPDAGARDAGGPGDAGSPSDGGGACPDFTMACDGPGTCVSTAVDRRCGTCSTNCTSAVDGTAVCRMMTDALGRPFFDCALDACAPGRFDCNGVWQDGCELLCSCETGADCEPMPCGSAGCVARCVSPPCIMTCSGTCTMITTSGQTGEVRCAGGTKICPADCRGVGECRQECVGPGLGTRCNCSGGGCV